MGSMKEEGRYERFSFRSRVSEMRGSREASSQHKDMHSSVSWQSEERGSMLLTSVRLMSRSAILVRPCSGTRELMELQSLSHSLFRNVKELSGVKSSSRLWKLRSKTLSWEQRVRGERLVMVLKSTPAQIVPTHSCRSQPLVLWQMEARPA